MKRNFSCESLGGNFSRRKEIVIKFVDNKLGSFLTPFRHPLSSRSPPVLSAEGQHHCRNLMPDEGVLLFFLISLMVSSGALHVVTSPRDERTNLMSLL
jgi:hypothetical protein